MRHQRFVAKPGPEALVLIDLHDDIQGGIYGSYIGNPAVLAMISTSFWTDSKDCEDSLL